MVSWVLEKKSSDKIFIFFFFNKFFPLFNWPKFFILYNVFKSLIFEFQYNFKNSLFFHFFLIVICFNKEFQITLIIFTILK
jgi:hypothetical protein